MCCGRLEVEDGGVRFSDGNGGSEIFGGGEGAKDSLRVRKIWAGEFSHASF